MLATGLQLTGVEFDVGVTADGVAVVHHDPRPNPDIARDASGAYVGDDAPLIRDLTVQQLAVYDVGRLRVGSAYAARFPAQTPIDGARIPALSDVLAACQSTDILIEIKTFPDRSEITLPLRLLVKIVLCALRQAHAVEKSVLCAFDWRVLEEAALQEPALRRCCLTEQQTVRRADIWFGRTRLETFGRGRVPRAVASAGATVWAPFHEMLDEVEMSEARSCDLAVLAWTVNEPAEIYRMIDLGVDGIISDRPDRVREALAERGIEITLPGFALRKSVSVSRESS